MVIFDKQIAADQQEELPGRCCSGNIAVQVKYLWSWDKEHNFSGFLPIIFSCFRMRNTVNFKKTTEIDPSIRI
jgi:hypothetical protein